MTVRLEALCPICEDGVTKAELEEIAWEIVIAEPGCSVCGDRFGEPVQ